MLSRLVQAIFWGATAIIAYAYLLFPALVVVRGRMRTRPVRSAPITPHVSLLIAAYNEEASIRARVENLLALDYPRDRIEIIIASDGSQDGTNVIAAAYAEQGIRLLALPRQGKAAALNAAVAASQGEILVFSDANSSYAPEAIRAIVRPFADPEVGGVAGNQVYLSAAGPAQSAQGEQSYWNFDRRMKQAQSQAGHTISATGAIYAIRRSLFRGVPAGVTDDFVTSTSVIAQGYRLVFAADAIAYEPAAGSSTIEFGRKVRVMTRGLRGVLLMRELLNPFRYGFYALQLFSHKVVRRLVALPLLALFVVSPLLWRRGWIYRLATLAQAGFYSLAAAGWLLRGTALGRHKIFSLPLFFCLVNGAALVAAFNLVRGHRIDRWEPQREPRQPADTA